MRAMPTLAYQRMIGRARLKFDVTIDENIEVPPCRRTTVPSMAIVDKYTKEIERLGRPAKWVRMLELLYYWPTLASEIVFNLDLRKKRIRKMNLKILREARSRFAARLRLKAKKARLQKLRSNKLKAKKAMVKKAMRAKAKAKKEEAVGKKGKTLKQLFSHSSSSSRV